MEFSEIKPFVRFAEKINETDCSYKDALLSYDHIMIYTISGTCNTIVEDTEYVQERGTVIIIKPGCEYKLCESEDFNAIMIHFDYDSSNSVEKSFYIKPQTADEFNKSNMINVRIQPEKCFNRTLLAKKCYHLEEYFKSIASECKFRNRYFDFKISATVIWILVDISRQIYNFETQSYVTGTNVINDIINYIHENYNKNITNESISKKFNFHSKYINILIKNKTGYSLHKYILLRRVTKAIDYLQNTNMHIYEIAEKVGFSDSCHFTKCFKQLVGENPKAFRKNRNS